jgi:hypothetical protein
MVESDHEFAHTSILSLFLAGTARGNSLRPADARSAGLLLPRRAGFFQVYGSSVPRRLHKKQPLALGAEPSRCKVSREKREQKTEDLSCTCILCGICLSGLWSNNLNLAFPLLIRQLKHQMV